jgi:Transglutaminase-like superfamily
MTGRTASTARSAAEVDPSEFQSRARTAAQGHRLFRFALASVSWLLLISIVILTWAAAREYSTQRYVDAFSDAIVPVSGPPEQKIQAILDWMAHPPARFTAEIDEEGHDRDPLDTLNYKSLLQVCGTATNAFINLADTSGLRARRLLLLDARRNTKHVDAEVFVNGRWIVVDPAFRVVLRGPDGRMLTRAELADPATFAAAVRNVPHYDPTYSFESTAHVRLAGIRYVGNPARRALNYLVPRWQNSAAISLVMERGELGDVILSVLLVLFVIAVRFLLRWYGKSRLHLELIPARLRVQRAYRAFVNPAG